MGEFAPRCPLGGEMIDESSARINATLTCALLLVAALTPYRWVLVYLVVDFALKVFAGFARSPNCMAAGSLASWLRLKRTMADSAPKRLAASIALFMSSLGLLAASAFPAYPQVYYAVVGVFFFFAFLEAAFGFCMGCWIFALLPNRLAETFVRRATEEV
ncbi:MAG: DUF4395 family protein [Coriobacteriia bacterium]|nr:DUF4395 family protein [Coriobacteriia bacterium]